MNVQNAERNLVIIMLVHTNIFTLKKRRMNVQSVERNLVNIFIVYTNVFTLEKSRMNAQSVEKNYIKKCNHTMRKGIDAEEKLY